MQGTPAKETIPLSGRENSPPQAVDALRGGVRQKPPPSVQEEE